MELVAVRTFLNHIDAELARTVLEAVGIKSVISADDTGGTRPHLAMSNGVRLLVRDSDLQEADEVLAAEVDPPEE